MKNNNQNDIKNARYQRSEKVATTDILLNPRVAQGNMQRLNQKPRRKRRTNYVKKITNDPFIFNV